jgi:hypothetical protein
MLSFSTNQQACQQYVQQQQQPQQQQQQHVQQQQQQPLHVFSAGPMGSQQVVFLFQAPMRQPVSHPHDATSAHDAGFGPTSSNSSSGDVSTSSTAAAAAVTLQLQAGDFGLGARAAASCQTSQLDFAAQPSSPEPLAGAVTRKRRSSSTALGLDEVEEGAACGGMRAEHQVPQEAARRCQPKRMAAGSATVRGKARPRAPMSPAPAVAPVPHAAGRRKKAAPTRASD